MCRNSDAELSPQTREKSQVVGDERRLNQLDGEDRFQGVNRAGFNEVIKTMVSGLDGQVGERVPRDSPGANLNPKRSKKNAGMGSPK
jgi:hypothetical protein